MYLLWNVEHKICSKLQTRSPIFPSLFSGHRYPLCLSRRNDCETKTIPRMVIGKSWNHSGDTISCADLVCEPNHIDKVTQHAQHSIVGSELSRSVTGQDAGQERQGPLHQHRCGRCGSRGKGEAAWPYRYLSTAKHSRQPARDCLVLNQPLATNRYVLYRCSLYRCYITCWSEEGHKVCSIFVFLA